MRNAIVHWNDLVAESTSRTSAVAITAQPFVVHSRGQSVTAAAVIKSRNSSRSSVARKLPCALESPKT